MRTYTGTKTLDFRSPCKSIGPSADLIDSSEESTPKENTSTIMSIEANDESRLVISLSTPTKSQKQTNESLESVTSLCPIHWDYYQNSLTHPGTTHM